MDIKVGVYFEPDRLMKEFQGCFYTVTLVTPDGTEMIECADEHVHPRRAAKEAGLDMPYFVPRGIMTFGRPPGRSAGVRLALGGKTRRASGAGLDS